MYRFIVRLFLFALIAATGCKKLEHADDHWHQPNGKLKVVTSIAMINDLVREIGGEDVDTIPLIRGELDPHSYELVKGDDEKFARADLIFYNGLGLEHGLSLRQNLENNPKAIAVADPLLETPGLVVEVDGQYDPHVWMDIALWVKTIDPIVTALSDKDPDHKEAYQKRGARLREAMHQADNQAFLKLQAIDPARRYLVTSHDAFHYFARHYLASEGERNWQKRCKAPEGLAPEAQMSVTDIVDIIAHIDLYRVGVLFSESNLSKDSLKKIINACQEKGLSLRLCQKPLYSDSMGQAPTYLEMINHNIDIIASELSR